MKLMRIPYLPAPEYHLLRELMKRYEVTGQQELIAAALRLTYEVLSRTDLNGHVWFVRIVDDILNGDEKTRRYETTE